MLNFWTPNSVQLNKYLLSILSIIVKRLKVSSEHPKRNKICPLLLRKLESVGRDKHVNRWFVRMKARVEGRPH